VTTAALPWKTGTAVNALLRAAALADVGHHVTLVVPWIHPSEQQMVFPGGRAFGMPEEQEAHMRDWLAGRQRAAGGTPHAHFEVRFYPARYDVARGSILPLGDLTRWTSQVMGACAHDLCVLEEPEHLTWYHNGPNWRHRFKLVVGVVHTNYLFYAKTWENGGPLAANTLSAINSIMCQAYCDKVIKLSDALQPLPRAVTCNVHGVRADFLDIGRRAARRPQWRRGAYFLGKALWAKGHRLLLGYLALQRERREPPSQIDIFGHGEDLGAIMAEAARMGASMSFHGPTDHAGERLREYKVFVNPSQSEVLSTTTAEALAMGKYVVLERHPSNAFFEPFRNALYYETPSEFLLQLRYALATEPAPLSDEEQRTLSWEGATERFLDAVTNSTLGDTLPTLSDSSAEWLHQALQESGLGDAVRKMSGGGPVARQAWLKSPLLRDADVTEIVEQSLVHSPPGSSSSET
jgi:digalactosyldiacylglycerol synthase